MGEGRWGVEVIVRDCGPGLDPKLALLEEAVPKSDRSPPSGPSARMTPRQPGQGLGLGLGAVHRLMSSVVIRSSPGVSTEIIAIKWQ
jgi:serine/threonine-protein kinase RsbT